VGNNRIYYGCLGVALSTPSSFPSSLLPGVQSVGINTSQKTEYILSPGIAVPQSYYSLLSDVTFTFVEAFQTLDSLSSISGCNNYIDLYMFIGEDNSECMDARKYIRCKYILLQNLIYNLDVNGIFTVEKTYNGFSRYICSTSSPITIPNCSTPIPNYSVVGSRRHFNISGSSLPSILTDDNILQTVTINQIINRENISEPATRTPYGSMTSFPIETKLTFSLISKNLDLYNNTFNTTICNNISNYIEDITISICGIGGSGNSSSLSFNDVYLESINYTGGDTSGGNQEINIEYISYSVSGINSLVEFPNVISTGC
jgi:hypothetical protein